MRIGVDIRPLQDANATRGIGAYLSNLLPRLVKIDANNEFVLIAYKNKKLPINLKSKNVMMVEIIEPKISKIKKYLKSNTPLDISQYRLDVFLQTDFQNPVVKGNTALVVVAYDLIPLHFKKEEFFITPSGQRATQKIKTRLLNIARFCKYSHDLKNYSKADRIIAISQFTAEDFKKSLGLTKPIAAALLAGTGAAAKSLKIPQKNKYLLYVGANEYRKNINFLIKIFKDMVQKHPDLKLKLVGHNFGDKKNIHTVEQMELVDNLGLLNKVEFMGFVDEGQKAKLYRNAACFVFPSLYEGFGLPVLEAMQNGCPVVAFNNSSIPEVTGNTAILANNKSEFIDGVDSMVSNESLRNKLIKSGLKQANKFSWEKTAKKTLKVLEEAARSKKV